MSLPRIIYENDTFYHVLNRVCGPKDYFPIDDTVKQKFLEIMNHLLEFHGEHIKIISYVMMDNHYHLVLSHDPAKVLTETDVQYRFFNYYSNEKYPLAWQNDSYKRVLKRMQSLSKFMGELDRRLASWFNSVYSPQKYGKIRRGHFWQNRYKSCIIDSSIGVRRCIAYVECNPLRAGLVNKPSDYHFSSYGQYKGTGTHPFHRNFAHYFLDDEFDVKLTEKAKFNKCIEFLENIFVNKLQIELFLSEEEAIQAMIDSPFDIISRRVRYWEDSKIIFCKLKKSEVAENIYEAKLNARKIVHRYKDKLGHVFKPLSWHQQLPEPDS